MLLSLSNGVLVREVGRLGTISALTFSRVRVASDSWCTQTLKVLRTLLLVWLRRSIRIVALVIVAWHWLSSRSVIVATTMVRSKSTSAETSGSTGGSTSGKSRASVVVKVLLSVGLLNNSTRRRVLGAVVPSRVETSSGVHGGVLGWRGVLVCTSRCVMTVVVVIMSVPRSSISTARTSSSQSRASLGVMMLVLIIILSTVGIILVSSVEKSTKLAALLFILVGVLSGRVLVSVGCCVTTVVVVTISSSGVSSGSASSTESRASLWVMVLVTILLFDTSNLILTALSAKETAKFAIMVLILVIVFLDLFGVVRLFVILAKERECSLLMLLGIRSISSLI
jgi:hypothetical protein